MNRTVLLEGPEVSIDGQALIVSESRFILGEIQSVEILRVPMAATGPIAMMVSGVICFFSLGGSHGLAGALLGVGLIAAAVVWWTQKKPSFHVSLSTKDGQDTPFESRDEQVAKNVMNAINEARSMANRTG